MTTKNYFTIAESPQIPGLRFRYFIGEGDYPNIMDIFNACKVVDRFDHTMTIEGVAHHFEHLERSNPFEDMLFIEIDDQPIGYGRVGWYPESNGDYIYYALGWVRPEWRRKGIGTAILHHNEGRIWEIAVEHPSAVQKFFQNDYNDRQPGVAALLAENGYQGVRWGYEMLRAIQVPLPEAPLPKGLEVRQATREADFRAIFWGQNEAFQDHWGHSPATEEDFQRWRSDPITFKPELWKVAWEKDEVAGMVLNFFNEEENAEYRRKRGYTEFISVRRPWRRRGLARSLLVQSIAMFREMGMEETCLGVDTQNPNQALNLYRGVGYQIDREHTTLRKPLE